MHTRLRIALVAVVVSSALLMVGSMHPWTVWDTKYDTVTVYGLKTSGASTLVIGLVVLAFVVPIARSSPRVGWPIGTMCLFLVALLVSAVHVARVPSPAPEDGAFSAGVGVWLCLAASVIGTIASLSVWHLMLEGGVSLATPSTA
jgi:peptidoglycan/LPS O-acetylase OafA/YrhL